MVSFKSLNFNSVGLPQVGANPSGTVVDIYDKFQEKKDNYIAVVIANDNNKKERASATLIGAMGGLLQFGVFSGIYMLAKTFPKLNNFLVDKFIVKNFDKWIDIARANNPGKSKLYHAFAGLYAKSMYAAVTGAVLGFGFDWLKTMRNTQVDGKISNTKSGVNGSWISAGLKSVAATQRGKELIKNSIIKNPDKTVTVKFNGINREYNLTIKELKQASRAYVTYTNDAGKVTGFKKKFSKGDGDVLAFELAFEKYCMDVNDGVIPPDKNIPKSVQTLSDTGEILFTDGSVSQLYYLLSGANKKQFNKTEYQNKNHIMDLYSKASIEHFMHDCSDNHELYAAEIKLKDNEKGKIKIRDKFYVITNLKTSNNYLVESMDKKYITLANSNKTRDKMIIPIDKIKEHIESVSYMKYDTNEKRG